MSEQGDTENTATTDAEEPHPEAEGTPTTEQRTMYETEDEELA